MAGLRELKKHLKSITTTGQLASAMKTVSSAKFSRVNAALQRYREYAGGCSAVMEQFGGALTEAMPKGNADAPIYYIVATSNRGLCGGYNSNLLAYAQELFAEKESGEYRIITLGRMAEGYFAEHGIETLKSFPLPDVPSFEGCMELFDFVWNAYTSGKASCVSFIYEGFRNMLTQTPKQKQILPLTEERPGAPGAESELLCIPDRATVMKNLCRSMIDAAVFETVLECAAGAQAATLIAMREACDNAEDSAAALELEISRKRQSEVTASVIETFSAEYE